MTLPCLKDYYVAAQLRGLVLLCNPTYEAKWKDIEFSLMNIPIQSVLGCLDRTKELSQIQNHWVGFSFKISLEVIKRFQLDREIKVLFWPAYNPALYDYRYRQWSIGGITALCKMVSNGEFDSFQKLCDSFDLGKQDFFRYLQIRHFYMKEVKGPNPVPFSGLTQFFYRCI